MFRGKTLNADNKIYIRSDVKKIAPRQLMNIESHDKSAIPPPPDTQGHFPDEAKGKLLPGYPGFVFDFSTLREGV